MFGYFLLGLSVGWFLGSVAMWFFIAKRRLLRSRKEWYADPIIKAKYGDDPDPDGWTY